MQDPEPYLETQKITVPCLLEPERPAVMDAAHRSVVNFELFYFSDEKAKARFDEDPLRYCGALTDPVSLERFIPGESSPRIDREGRAYVFLSEASLAQFEALPDSFSVPHFRMREMMNTGDAMMEMRPEGGESGAAGDGGSAEKTQPSGTP